MAPAPATAPSNSPVNSPARKRPIEAVTLLRRGEREADVVDEGAARVLAARAVARRADARGLHLEARQRRVLRRAPRQLGLAQRAALAGVRVEAQRALVR